MNLLIVDDEVIAVKAMLEGVDWVKCGIDGEIYTAYDAQQAKECLMGFHVDIILCDIEMPGANGIELIHYVNKEYPEIVSIFLTCHAKFEYAQEAIHLGCEDYILTPSPFEVIEKTVEKTVNKLKNKQYEEQIQKYGEQWIHSHVETAANAQGDNRSTQEIVQHTADYIIENLDNEKLSVSHLASYNYLNSDYLNRIFKREKGISINQFIIKERMELACQLLLHSNINITTIASQAGYSNYPYFVSTFKRINGMTPTQYRNQHTEK